MGALKMNKPIEEMIAESEREIARHQERIKTLKELQARATGGVVPVEAPTTRQRTRRGDLKATVLNLLQERGSHGLNAAIAAEITAKRGDPVDRNSVSSLLSRLKTDGVVDHEGGMYRLIGIKDSAPGEHVH